MKPQSAIWAVFVGGSIAGTLDIAYAMAFTAFHGIGPLIVLQSVASGAMGKVAFSGGLASGLLGLALHLLLSFAWAAILLLCASRHPALVRRVVPASAVFGIVVYLVMHFVVMPLSAYPRAIAFKPVTTTLDLLAHVFLFGMPIIMTTRKLFNDAR